MQSSPGALARAAPLLLCLSLLPLPSLAARERPAQARGGVIELAGLGPGEAAALAGEWGFYWRRFLDPAEPEAPGAFAPFPGEWRDYRLPGVEPLGYASYRLLVRGLDPGLELGLRLPSFLNAARVFADGREIDAQGRPGPRPSEEEPGWASRVVRLGPQPDGELDLLIQVSNWSDRTGGGRRPLVLGDWAAVAAIREGVLLRQAFFVGGILLMGVYYLFLFAFRPSDGAPLHFGLLCLVLALRVLCYDEYYLQALLPGLPSLWLFRIGFLTFTAGLALFAGFMRSLYPRLFPAWALWAAAIASGAYSLLILAARPLAVAASLPAFQLLTLAFGLYVLAVLARAVRRRERGSLILGAGFLLLFAAVVHDILSSNGLLEGPFALQEGLLAFLFCLSLVITRKFAASFAVAETLSADLARTNLAMRRFVPAQFLERLGKSRIEEVALGDHAAQEMTVLFADIGQFTRLSEGMSPEENFAFINEYLARVGPAIRAHRGFVDKYYGDGIMALFPESPEDALRCAIEMQVRIGAYNEERRAAGKEPISVGIGLHAGRIMLGTIGESERMDGTVISDAVNLASRVEGVAKLYAVGIAVSERVLVDLEDPGVYRLRFLGRVGVKGRREPLSVFEVYDGDPEELRARKDGIRGAFERALGKFYEQSYREALEGFKAVLEGLPGDEASQHYIRIIRKLGAA